MNDLDQTLLGERRRTGLFRRDEEVEEDEAQNLQQRLEQQRHQQERPRPDSGAGSFLLPSFLRSLLLVLTCSSSGSSGTVGSHAHQGPSQGNSSTACLVLSCLVLSCLVDRIVRRHSPFSPKSLLQPACQNKLSSVPERYIVFVY